MRKLVLAFAMAAEAAGPAWAEDPPCVSKVVQACLTVHGRLTAANGTPSFRIWIVGTDRMLGIVGGEEPPLPDVVRRALGPDVFANQVFGDYTVCPLTQERLGWMQMVCVKDASRLVVQKH